MSTTKVDIPGEIIVADVLDATGEMIAGGGIRLASSTGPIVISGIGDPNGMQAAPAGSLFVQTDTPQAIWQNTSTGSPWTAWTKLGSGGGGAFSGVSAHSTTGQDIDVGVWTALLYNTTDFDTDTYHKGTSSVFTVPSDGYYRITAGVSLGFNFGTLTFSIAKNCGGTYDDAKALMKRSMGAGDLLFNSVGIVSTAVAAQLDAGDTIETFVYYDDPFRTPRPASVGAEAPFTMFKLADL